MLRLLVLLLVLSNAAYFAWTHSLLTAYGLAPAAQSEPQRLMQQIHPEVLHLLTPAEARQFEARPGSTPASNASLASGLNPIRPASAASPQSTMAALAACLQAGLFNEEQAAVLRARLQSVLPPGSWALESSVEPARWMVYMGKYSSEEVVAKKKGELRQLRVSFEVLANPALEPGLSLGTFSSQAEAELEMARIAKRGVRTAKVILALPEAHGQKLRLPAVDPGMRVQLDALKPQLAGKVLQACT